MKKANLDAEERDILESVERGEWRSVRGVKQEVHRLQVAARNTLAKDRRINIRMSSKDLTQVQALAAQEGLPYQTLISSIIHKYVSGNLREKRTA
jgi:predicted DNA binding CopG/RHH family protein